MDFHPESDQESVRALLGSKARLRAGREAAHLLGSAQDVCVSAELCGECRGAAQRAVALLQADEGTR